MYHLSFNIIRSLIDMKEGQSDKFLNSDECNVAILPLFYCVIAATYHSIFVFHFCLLIV